MATITTLNDWITANSFRTQTNTNFSNLNTDKQETSWKDASGGYAWLTLLKINFKNVANTFTSFFTNSNTASRTYTFQDRNGTIADDTDLALKWDKSGNLSQFASTTSSQLAWVISDETGSGSLVFATSPTLVTPIINLWSDATWDVYYRNSGWSFTRLWVWSNWQILTLSSWIPSWQNPTWSADYSVRITQSSGQSITLNTLTVVTFDTESYDTDTMHDTSTNTWRVTFTHAWKYHISWVFNTDANVGCYWWIRLNWSTYIFKAWVGNVWLNTWNGFTIWFDYVFSASDYIELLGTFWSTSSTKSWQDWTQLSAHLIA